MTKTKKLPMRQCVGCRQVKDKKDLIRIIRNQDNEISVDITGRKNGRGAYICRSQECLKRAIRQKALERAFKQRIPEEVYENLIEELKDADG